MGGDFWFDFIFKGRKWYGQDNKDITRYSRVAGYYGGDVGYAGVPCSF